MDDQKVLQAYAAEFLDPHEETGELQGYLISESDERLVRHTFNIESVLRKIVSTSEPLYRTKSIKAGTSARLIPTDLGMEVMVLLKGSLSVIPKHRKYYEFNPYILAFVDVANELNFHWPELEFNSVDTVSIVDILQSCAERLRKLWRDPGFKSKLRNYRRSASKNFSEINRYIDGLFLNWPNLMVVRLELGYREPDLREERVSDDERTRGFERLAEDRVKLLKLIRKKTNLVGFIWKLEYGPDRSYRCHLILCFDGSNVSKGLRWGKMIGEIWVKEVTQGDGVYFNFNESKLGNWFDGIGMVEQYDEAARERLMKAVIYLTKPDYYLRIVTPRNARALGKGQLPKVPKA